MARTVLDVSRNNCLHLSISKRIGAKLPVCAIVVNVDTSY